MDTFTPFQFFNFDSFTFESTRYEEYCDGKLISTDNIEITVFAKSNPNGVINIILVGNSIKNKILTEFEFDTLITLEDRMQFTIFPKETNVEDVTFQLLRSMIEYTRKNKNFTPIEPIVGHIFTDNMSIVKMSFKMTNPVRLLEFY